MFHGWFQRRKVSQKPLITHTHEQPNDQLNQTATEIALNIIQEKGSESYRNSMIEVFKNVPSLVLDVDTKHQASLKEILRSYQE